MRFDADGDTTIEADEMGILNDGCEDTGKALLTDVLDNGVVDVPDANELDESADNTYTFTLTKTARDMNADGVVDDKDFTVMVNNSTLKATGTTGGETGYFTLTVDDTAEAGRGVTAVVIHNKVPNNDIGDARSVVITYEYSEYNFETTGAATPLNIAGSRVFHGDDRSNLDETGVTGVNSAGPSA